jgi:hypothetical protein
MIFLVEDWLNNFDPDRENFEFYDKLIHEELAEFNEEPDDLKEACDLIWVAMGKALQKFSAEDLSKGLIEVHKSNMSKLSPTEEVVNEWLRINGMQFGGSTVKKIKDGYIAVRNDGKILKGPSYKLANIAKITPIESKS